jgi:hypothetical protein
MAPLKQSDIRRLLELLNDEVWRSRNMLKLLKCANAIADPHPTADQEVDLLLEAEGGLAEFHPEDRVR